MAISPYYVICGCNVLEPGSHLQAMAYQMQTTPNTRIPHSLMSTGITTKLTFQELTNADVRPAQALQKNRFNSSAWSSIKKKKKS